MAANTKGSWGSLLSWPVVGIHSVLTQDGKVLTFGTDQSGIQGAMMYHDLWDPVTGEHTTLNHAMHTATDIFCANAIIVPGTDNILISGGDARPLGAMSFGVADVNNFNTLTEQITPDVLGQMHYARWYATVVSLPNGQIVVMGGTDRNGAAVQTPEIYTPGVGWKDLTGATSNQNFYYDRAFVNGDGNIVYFVGSAVMMINPTGNGSITQVGTAPFGTSTASPSVQIDAGHALVNDGGSGLWKMDFTGPAVTFTKVGDLGATRIYSNMTVLADGKILINGGSTAIHVDATAIKTALIFDPANNSLTPLIDEAMPRLYHSTSLLLPDGTVLTAGGGALGGPSATLATQLNGQIYKPAYLFDANGNEATRPVITAAPDHMQQGTTFTIQVDNAADIAKLTFVKNGAITHSFNMNAGMVELKYTVGPNNTLNVTLPDYHQGVSAGSWMLFAWNKAGVPSIAPVLEVDPVFNTGGVFHAENLLTNGSFETAANVTGTTALNTVVGWHSSASKFDVWKDGYQNTDGTDGATSVEVAADNGLIYQDVHTVAGKAYALSFDYAGHAGAVASSAMQVLWNGVVVGTINPTDAIAHAYTFQVTGTGNKDVLGFRSLATDTDATGGFLDNVILKTTDGSTTPPTLIHETAPVNLLANGSFEITSPAVTDPFSLNGPNAVTGWTSSVQTEVWRDGFYGQPATDGHNLLEVDAVNGSLSQAVNTTAGQSYHLSFDMAGRAGAIASSKLEVVWNGQVVSTITPSDSIFHQYNLDVIGTGHDTLAFRSVAGDTDGLGALLDNVKLVAPTGAVTPPHGTDVEHIVNGSFEITSPAATAPVSINGPTAITGWTSTAATEVWRDGYNGQFASEGRNIVEVDAVNGTLSQTVNTTAGQKYHLSFDMAGRAGAIASSKLEVVWNGQVVSTITPTDSIFHQYNFDVTATGHDTLAFRSVAGDTDGAGALLDHVSLMGPAQQQTGSMIMIDASGSTGQESMALFIDGVQVATYDNVPTGGKSYMYMASGTVTPSQVRVAFTNDVWDPANGIDRNLTVDKISIDGKTYQTEASTVLSTGTWSNIDNTIQPGYGRGDTLHTTGYFQYAEAAAPPTGPASTITITAAGSTGQESMALFIDGLQVATFDNVPTAGRDYVYTAATAVRPGQVRIAFTNDVWDPANGIDRNLTVDKISIDGATYQTEASTVLSTGTWSNIDNAIQPGYGRGDTLHTTGYFQYADTIAPPPTGTGSMITISAAGSTGQESMALFIDGVQVATFNNVPTTATDFMFHASGTVHASQVRVAFTNDAWDPANGVDRNLTVDKIVIDGTTYQSEDKSVYSTATWSATDGTIQPGYGRGDTLASNGYFQYADAGGTTTPPSTGAHTNLLTNGSFETVNATLSDGQISFSAGKDAVPGWSSTTAVEVWHDGFNAQPGTDGRNAIEVDAANGTLSQSVMTTAGTTYGLSFDLAGRTNFVSSSKLDVVWNGQVISTITPTDNVFHQYAVNVVGTGHDTLSFKSVDGDNDGAGALLDNVILHDHSLPA